VKVLVTGASGFVGRAVVTRLAGERYEILAAARSPAYDLPTGVRHLPMNALGDNTDPLPGDCEAEIVVHAAGRAHVMRETSSDPLVAFRAVNVGGSLAVARQVRESGARRFVFISSIKVLGERTHRGQPFNDDSVPAPADAYGQSKLEAERALTEFCDRSSMELVIVRPPLVYGPGVKANFEQLLRAVSQRRPLPLGQLHENLRSLVALDNLVDLICTCTRHVAAPGRTFLVSDGEDLSTVDLVQRLARAFGVAPRLVPVPVWALQLAGTLTGRRDAVRRLCESLQADISGTRRALDWTPPITVDEGLARAVEPYSRDTTR